MAGSAAEYAHVAEVTPEFFRVFAIDATSGRLFSSEEQKTGSAAVISYAYWQSHFGGGSNALGLPLHMFSKSFAIIGVLPPGFQFPHGTDIWFPANTVFPETSSRSGHNYRVVGRLKPGMSLEQAQAQMTAIGARLEEQYKDSNTGKSVAVTRMRDEMVHNVRLTLYLLLGAVCLVLLIGCANVANLLLARATSRTREMAIRAAVGAGRGRIVRQLITESLVLSLVAAALGLLLARWVPMPWWRLQGTFLAWQKPD